MAVRAWVALRGNGDIRDIEDPVASGTKERIMYIGLGTLILVIILILVLT